MQNQLSTLMGLTLAAGISILFSFSFSLEAGEKEHHIIDKAVEAYGGKKLLQLQSLILTDTMNQYSQWQSAHSLQGPMITYLSRHQIEFTVDFLNQRKVFKQATSRLIGSHASEVPTVSHRIFADGKGVSIDHALQHYQHAENINFGNADLGTVRLLDTLIIRQLNNDRNASQWTDIAFIQGEAHDVLTLHAGTENECVVYLNQQSGYLTRVLRNRSKQLLTYDFLEHQQSQGITWAKHLLVSSADNPVYHSDAREISLNSAQDHQFNLPSGYLPKPETRPVDVSNLTLKELAPGVYFVGQYWGYTLFIDAGSYLISAGTWQMDNQSRAWQKGLELLREKTGNNKPVKQHIVTHHHHDHMMGLNDVLAQGAKLVIHPADIQAVQQHLPTPLPEEQFIPVSETTHIANGKVMLFDVSNSHANHNMVIYLPEYKILFSEDMFGSSFQTGFNSPASWPDSDAYFRLEVLLENIRQSGLTVEQYVSSHHARVLTQEEINLAMQIQRPSKETLMNRLFPK